MFFVYIINKLSHDFSRGIWNKQTLINFSKARKCLLVFEKFTRTYLLQIALEIM